MVNHIDRKEYKENKPINKVELTKTNNKRTKRKPINFDLIANCGPFRSPP
jgi:hypothetical protein